VSRANPVGVGLSLRAEWVSDLLRERPALPFVEVIADNFVGQSADALPLLDAVAEHYPVALHCVGMNLGSTDPLNLQYLETIRALAERVDAMSIADHLSWTGVGGAHMEELLPLPFSEEAIAHVVSRIGVVQERLGQELLIENVSRYVRLAGDEMPEWAFVSEILKRSGCASLLDVANIAVSAANTEFSAEEYVDTMPIDAVKQIHVAGYEDWGDVLVDTHSRDVPDDVASLLARALERFGSLAVVLEWDRNIPPWRELLAARDRVQQIATSREAA
jgi:uncharacterized protein (UPF0276 family)